MDIESRARALSPKKNLKTGLYTERHILGTNQDNKDGQMLKKKRIEEQRLFEEEM